MMRTHSLRLFLLLLLAVTIPILLFSTGSGRADDREGKGDRRADDREGKGDSENEGKNQREGQNDRAVRLFGTVAIRPTAANTTADGLYSFDISWVDQATQTYYIADRSNKAVDIVDSKTLKLIHQLSGDSAGLRRVAPRQEPTTAPVPTASRPRRTASS